MVTRKEESVTNFSALPEVVLDTERSLTADISGAASEGLSEPQKTVWHPAIQVFLSTFLTIFLAELGDKTQVTTLLMAAESHQPWVVFVGAGTALVATSLIGVWLGCWLAKRVSAQTLEKAAGVLLLLIAAQLCWEVIHL